MSYHSPSKKKILPLLTPSATFPSPDYDKTAMPRPHLQQHIPAENPSIQQSIVNKPHYSSATHHRSPTLNQPNQIIEMINDSSSPPTPSEVQQPPKAFQLPPLLNNQPQTAHTMSSDHQRPQYQPTEPRRRSDERRHWQEPPPRPEGQRPSHVFHLKEITVYSQPYSYTFNREPLYLQFGTQEASEAARAVQMATPPALMPAPYIAPREREEYRPYAPRQSRQFEDDRYEPYDPYNPRNYEPYEGNREYDRRGEAIRRSEEYEGVRYRHSTGQGAGPVIGPGSAAGPSAAGPSGAGRTHGEGQDDTEEYERGDDDESGEMSKRRQRLPTTRTYRDFSHVPSISGQSEEHKRYSTDEPPMKRARLNWSEDLHSKFLEAVHELGVEKAVPTSIMKRMQVDGLTRENVASHLQKYRGTIKKEKEEQERRLLLKAAAKSVVEDGDSAKLTEEEVLKAVAEREESYKAPAKKRGGKDR